MHPVLAFFALVVFLLATYGLANAISVLKFGLPIRKVCKPVPVLGALICCPACIAFWLGLGGSVGALSPSAAVIDIWWKAMVVDGLMASGFTWVVHVLAEKLGHGVVD
jgi:hypothetical protein